MQKNFLNVTKKYTSHKRNIDKIFCVYIKNFFSLIDTIQESKKTSYTLGEGICNSYNLQIASIQNV